MTEVAHKEPGTLLYKFNYDPTDNSAMSTDIYRGAPAAG